MAVSLNKGDKVALSKDNVVTKISVGLGWDIAKYDFDGDLIKGNSQRYQTFFTKGCKCAICGIEGKYFAKERHLQDKAYHLNLYAVDDNGTEILMTKDHILPRSKGGIDDISNYQTMCKPCNEVKGNKLEN